MTTTTLDRFMAKTSVINGCWVWTGCVNSKNYGCFSVKGKVLLAHRWSHEQFIGPIAEGLQVDHLCRITRCVNPAHLEAVTARVNNNRSQAPSAVNARKDRCDAGHLFDEANTYVRDPLKGWIDFERGKIRWSELLGEYPFKVVHVGSTS